MQLMIKHFVVYEAFHQFRMENVIGTLELHSFDFFA